MGNAHTAPSFGAAHNPPPLPRVPAAGEPSGGRLCFHPRRVSQGDQSQGPGSVLTARMYHSLDSHGQTPCGHPAVPESVGTQPLPGWGAQSRQPKVSSKPR